MTMSNSDARKRLADAAAAKGGIPETTAEYVRRLEAENRALRTKLLIATESEAAEAGEHEAVRNELQDLRDAITELCDEWDDEVSEGPPRLDGTRTFYRVLRKHGSLAREFRALLDGTP